MSESISVQAAWAGYGEAVRALYAPPAEAGERAARAGGEIPTGDIEERSQAVVASSRQFGDALAAALRTDDLDQRELVSWKLLAAAAQDLSVAGDLLALEEAGPEAVETRGARSAIALDPVLKAVLAAPLDTRPADLAEEATRRAAQPTEPGKAKAQLDKTIDVFAEEIPDAAASMSQKAVTGLISAGLAPAQQLLAAAGGELLALVPAAASAVVRNAATLLAEAIRKLLSNFPKELQDQASDQAAAWVKQLQESQDTVANLLDKFYETQRIGAATHSLVEGTPEDLPAAAFNQATQGLEALMARYAQTKKIVESCLRVLAFARTPLMAAVPWGPVGIYGVYAGVLIYAVFSGGDYLDAERLSQWAWMDRVQGMQTTVGNAVKGQPSASAIPNMGSLGQPGSISS